jgi:hypothetical protein
MVTKKKTTAPKKAVAKKTTTTSRRAPSTTKAKTTGVKTTSKTKSTNEKVAKAKPKKTVNFTGMTPKQIADAKGEPWVSVVQVELDPDNIGNGAFELDWNDKFVTNLVRSGYKGKTDADMVDQWFQDVCRNVVQENYEQWEANQPLGERPREIQRRDLGDGRTEVS